MRCFDSSNENTMPQIQLIDYEQFEKNKYFGKK
jgi:hypothetical protein